MVVFDQVTTFNSTSVERGDPVAMRKERSSILLMNLIVKNGHKTLENADSHNNPRKFTATISKAKCD